MQTMNPTEVDAIINQVREALAQEDWGQVVKLVEALRPPDQADIFGELPPSEQDELLPRLDVEDSADILEELQEKEAAEVAARLEPEELAGILDEMEPDEAADLLGDIAPAYAAQVLAAMEEPDEVRPLLVHADESAGGLMTSAKVTLHRKMTVEQALAYLRTSQLEPDTVYYLLVVDQDVRLAGVVPLRRLIISPPTTPIEDIMDTDIISVQAEADQEEAARLMARYDLLALPVVDDENHLLGLITHDDLVEVLEEEATEDIYRLGGVPGEQPYDAPISAALRLRLPWLLLNMITALVSGIVLNFFKSTIAQVAALTVFFPFVAGVCGSAGTQTLTVTVRGLAMGELTPRDGLATLAREMFIGLINGLSVGVLVTLIALVLGELPVFGLIVGAAILLNMVGAGIAGALVPIAMQAVRVDPALASPILVTTITDTLGYLLYLGMATLILIPLI
jgi:magnesium transporter